ENQGGEADARKAVREVQGEVQGGLSETEETIRSGYGPPGQGGRTGCRIRRDGCHTRSGHCEWHRTSGHRSKCNERRWLLGEAAPRRRRGPGHGGFPGSTHGGQAVEAAGCASSEGSLHADRHRPRPGTTTGKSEPSSSALCQSGWRSAPTGRGQSALSHLAFHEIRRGTTRRRSRQSYCEPSASSGGTRSWSTSRPYSQRDACRDPFAGSTAADSETGGKTSEYTVCLGTLRSSTLGRSRVRAWQLGDSGRRPRAPRARGETGGRPKSTGPGL
ncbi:unnamed protein product, partial [Symbiodinium sp. CCMP2456]